jgi:hypothetical protein
VASNWNRPSASVFAASRFISHGGSSTLYGSPVEARRLSSASEKLCGVTTAPTTGLPSGPTTRPLRPVVATRTSLFAGSASEL